VRPSFEVGGQRMVEVHILDTSTKLSTGFDENIYGCDLVVEFVERLREERRYANIEELKAQIEQDIVQARRILAGTGKQGTRNE
jgi:riboflavin kinase/FMN adenylyltransferase